MVKNNTCVRSPSSRTPEALIEALGRTLDVVIRRAALGSGTGRATLVKSYCENRSRREIS
jgi:hypothetical protein